MAKPKKKPPIEYSIVRIQEINKTVRTCFIGGCIVVGLLIIANSVVKILDKPAWVEVALALIVAILGPSGIIFFIIKRMRAYTRTDHQRVIELEKKIDPKRITSDLPKDGTNLIE